MATKKVLVNNKIEVSLTDKNFLSSGGEGELYKKDKLVYKVYHKAPVSYERKIKELQVLSAIPNIVTPKDLLYSKQSSFIGYTMPFVDKAAPLFQLFTTSFRNRNSVSMQSTGSLVNNMMDVIQKIHDNSILMVDGNELNYMVDSASFEVPYFIDVDSYQTKNFPAPVIMPSIRDYHSKSFSELTDWFSFAVVAFQLFIGIHPYKGSHINYKPSQLQERMEANLSVFNKSVKTPASVRSFDLIPADIRDWFFRLFEKGERSKPPIIQGKILAVKQQTYVLAHFIQELYLSFPEFIGRVENNIFYSGENAYTVAGKKIPSAHSIVSFEGVNYDVYTENDSLRIFDTITEKHIVNDEIKATRVGIFNKDVYAINDEKLFSIKLLHIGTKTIASVQNSWPIMPNSTKMYGGLVFSNILGKYYVYIPANTGGLSLFNVFELEGYRILDMKYEKGVLQAVVMKNGSYSRFVAIFDSKGYTVKWYHDIVMTETNFTVLDNGLYLTLTASNELIVSSKLKDQDKILTECNIPVESVLFSSGNQVYYAYQDKAFSIKMK